MITFIQFSIYAVPIPNPSMYTKIVLRSLIAVFAIFPAFLSAQTFVNANVSFPVDNLTSAAWGDIDNDGDLDLALAGSLPGPQGGFTAIYVNNNGTFSAIPASDLQGGTMPQLYNPGFNLLEWGDYNNDNLLDLALIGTDDNGNEFFKIWRNEGNNVFFNSIDLPGCLCYDVEWADVDNDGDQDLLSVGFNSNSSGTKLYLNDWNNGNEAFVLSQSFTRLSNSVADFADYDLDGDLDLVIAGFYGITSNRLTQLWDNDGTGNFTQNMASPFAGVDWGDLDWFDLDNDGDPDLMLTGYEGGNFYPPAVTYAYRNVGGTLLFDTMNIGVSAAGYSSTALGDYDHDGDPDLIIQGDSTNSFEVFTRVYRNNGTQGMAIDPSISLPQQIQGNVDWIDYDGDGDLDLFVSGLAGSGVNLYTNTDPSITNQPPAPPTGLLGVSAGPNAATFSWAAPTDDVTPSAGLTYHLMLDTLSGSGYGLGAPMADTATGLRTVARPGDISTNSWTLRNLIPGKTYIARVSAIDAGLAGSAFSDAATTITLGLLDGGEQFVLNAGPIPARNHLTIRAEGVSAAANVQVVNLSGQVLVHLQTDQLNGQQLDLTGLPAGMFLLRVQLDGQERVNTLRFVKE